MMRWTHRPKDMDWFCLSLSLLLSVQHTLVQSCNCPIQEPDICDKCSCTQGSQRIINCKGQGLTQVPTFTSSTFVFDEVTLADNPIPEIPPEKFKELHGLQKLDITGTNIWSIDSNAFVGIGDTLQELYLEVNDITSFPKDALSGLTNLRTLSATGFDLSGSGLPAGAFNSLNALTVLDLQNNKLRDLPANTMTGLDNNLEELVLNHNSINNIPTDTLSSLQQLQGLNFINNQGLSNIGADAFQGSNIKHLDLSQNGLSLNVHSFRGLENSLENLTMRSCQLEDSMLPAVQSLASLKGLELGQNNRIVNIPDNFFSQMSSLETLNVVNCEVHTLRRATFNGLGNLQELDISDNLLTNIAQDTFSATPNLAILNMAQNPNLADELPSNIFMSVVLSLSQLSLAGTGFGDSHWQLVNDLVNIKSLTLSDNQIQNLADKGFEKLKELENLSLDNNDIGTVTQSQLYGTNNNLISVNLNLNNIQTLPECVFYEFTQIDLFLLGLNDNPLHCDCQLKWLLQSLQEDPDYETDKYFLNWRCSTPSHLHNMIFSQQLQQSDLTCSTPITSPPCQDLGPTIPPTTMTQIPSSETPYHFDLNISKVTDISMFLMWEVSHTEDPTGFSVEYWLLLEGRKNKKEFSSTTRNCTVDNLEPSEDYIVCVIALGVNWPIAFSVCDNVQTMPPLGQSNTPRDNTLIIALSCTLGALIIIAIIIVVVVVKRKQKQKLKQKDPYDNSLSSLGIRASYESKRFSKPTKDNVDLQNNHNLAFDHKMEGFSRDERDKILGMVSQHGASTLSMISNASSQRYVRDLPALPTDRVSYLNSQEELDKHVYMEIPEEITYQQIPDTFV